MAQRTTTSAVQTLLGNDWDGTTNVQQFIDAATVIVNRVVTCASNKNKALLSTEQELIERWLACYFYAKNDPIYMSKSTGGASASFQRRSDMGFEENEYGQGACRVDFSGCLLALGKRKTAGGFLATSPTNGNSGRIAGPGGTNSETNYIPPDIGFGTPYSF